jgi:hypothetical protein
LVGSGDDLRHTFATRLLERGVHHYVISALLGHSSPLAGAGFGSRTTGYAHVSWETMVKAVEALEQPVSPDQNVFSLDSGKIPADSFEVRSRLRGEYRNLLKQMAIDMVGAWGFEPQTPTVSTHRSTLPKANKSGIFLRNAAPPDQLPDQSAQLPAQIWLQLVSLGLTPPLTRGSIIAIQPRNQLSLMLKHHDATLRVNEGCRLGC